MLEGKSFSIPHRSYAITCQIVKRYHEFPLSRYEKEEECKWIHCKENYSSKICYGQRIHLVSQELSILIHNKLFLKYRKISYMFYKRDSEKRLYFIELTILLAEAVFKSQAYLPTSLYDVGLLSAKDGQRYHRKYCRKGP